MWIYASILTYVLLLARDARAMSKVRRVLCVFYSEQHTYILRTAWNAKYGFAIAKHDYDLICFGSISFRLLDKCIYHLITRFICL